jgi:tetratricopeptide (TPR) repeat protein
VQRTQPLAQSWFAICRRHLATYWLMGRLALAQRAQNHERVLQLGEEILTRNPRDVPTQLAMAKAAEKANWLGLAQAILELALDQKAENVPVLRALGYLLEKRGAYFKAIKQWENVKRIDPTDSEADRKIRNLTALETMERGEYQALFATTKRPTRMRART